MGLAPAVFGIGRRLVGRRCTCAEIRRGTVGGKTLCQQSGKFHAQPRGSGEESRLNEAKAYECGLVAQGRDLIGSSRTLGT